MVSQPLDFSATLDLLAGWEGRDVLVIAHSQVPGEPQSHSQLTARGRLGPVQMVDNLIDGEADSVAAFSIGEGRGVLYVTPPPSFVHAQPLPGEHINIKFTQGFHIEVQTVPGSPRI